MCTELVVASFSVCGLADLFLDCFFIFPVYSDLDGIGLGNCVLHG